MQVDDYSNDPLWDEDSVAAITDKLLPLLQDLIKHRNLTGADVMAALAQLSASHIHSMQGLVNGPEEKDAIENAYYKILDYYLAAFDANDLLNEVEEMKRERMN